jgi:hypothetical protein
MYEHEQRTHLLLTEKVGPLVFRQRASSSVQVVAAPRALCLPSAVTERGLTDIQRPCHFLALVQPDSN